MKTTLTKCEKCDFTRLDYEIKNVNECLYCYGKNKKFSKTQMNAMINFYKRINELGGKVIGEYSKDSVRVECKCKNEHECSPIPGNIRQGQGRGMCLICTGQDPETAKQNFYKRIKELEGEVIGEYVNARVRVECKCKKGHDCNPLPNSIQQGYGMCKICAGNDSKTAKQNFYNNIKKLGGEVIGEYVNNNTPVKCKCKNEHDCNPRPSGVQQGHGMCLICTGQDPETAKQNFYKRIKELGGEVIGEYVNNNTPVECKCKNEHICNPRPSDVQQGQGMCNKCITNGYSKVAIKWIESISKNIQHAENIGEYCIQNTKYKVDGYDEKTNTIYEFHGCFWHGCVKCYTDREEMNPISKKTYEELFKKTIERIEIFKNLGYNVVEKWECELKI